MRISQKKSTKKFFYQTHPTVSCEQFEGRSRRRQGWQKTIVAGKTKTKIKTFVAVSPFSVTLRRQKEKNVCSRQWRTSNGAVRYAAKPQFSKNSSYHF
jgi:hypothetical protein